MREPEKKRDWWIAVVSVAVPVVVLVLFSVHLPGPDFSFLPPIYASINAVTSVLLISAYLAIRSGKRKTHERLMKTNIGLSVTFLLMYVLYHMTSDPTPFGGQGSIRAVYFFVLISHILLSVAVIPLVLLTYTRAAKGDFVRHRRLAKFTLPVWLYVTVTGVIVYIMISPYYI